MGCTYSEIEGLVLAGGQLRRGGVGEAHGIRGLTLAHRICRSLSSVVDRVTVAGETPIPPFQFLPDAVGVRGPMHALAGFEAERPFVFVASCNLIGFSPDIVGDLRNRIGERAAVVPMVSGIRQPLCGLYRRESFEILRTMVLAGERNLDKWLMRIHALEINASCLASPAACFNLKMPVSPVKAVVALKDQGRVTPSLSRFKDSFTS